MLTGIVPLHAKGEGLVGDEVIASASWICDDDMGGGETGEEDEVEDVTQHLDIVIWLGKEREREDSE